MSPRGRTYVWRPGARTRSTSHSGALALRRRVGAALQRDPSSGEPFYRWRTAAGATATCLCTDVAALRPRVRMLRAAGLTVGLRVPGTEDPAAVAGPGARVDLVSRELGRAAQSAGGR